VVSFQDDIRRHLDWAPDWYVSAALHRSRIRTYRIGVREIIRAVIAAILGGLLVLGFSVVIGTTDTTTLIIRAIVAILIIWVVVEAIQIPRVRQQISRPFRAIDKRLGRPRLVRTRSQSWLTDLPPTLAAPPAPTPAPTPPPAPTPAQASAPAHAKTQTSDLIRLLQARKYLWALDEVAIELVTKGAKAGNWDELREMFVRTVLAQARAMIMHHVSATERQLGFLECVDAAEKFTPAIHGQQPPAHHHLRLIPGPGLTSVDIADAKAWGNDRGLANEAILSGAPQQEPDCRHPRTKFVPAHRAIGALLCVPVQIEDMVLGVISADCPKKGAFSPTDAQTMTELASKIALAYASAPPGGKPLRP
jgi:hypothetical protein